MKPPTPTRVALFGGAFDPPHLVHTALVQQALFALDLDVCELVPTGQAWHKPRPLTAAHHRLAMAQLAFAELDKVRINDVEIRRTGPSYTIDTVSHIRQRYPQAQLYLLLGLDQWLAFTCWKDWAALLEQVKVVVLKRTWTDAQAATTVALPQPMWLNLPPSPTSSTAIRQHIANNGPDSAALQTWLHPDVNRYISQHLLYSENTHP